MLGQEYIPNVNIDWPVHDIERSPTVSELSSWNEAGKISDRVLLVSHICDLTLMNIGLASDFCLQKNISLPGFDKSILNRYTSIRKEIYSIRESMRQVEDNVYACQFSHGDIDIVDPPNQAMGAIWIPIAIGALIVGGIIARWVQLERETGELSDQFNGVLKRADDHLCADPSSEACIDWETAKAKGGYYKRETVIGNIKDAIKGTGKAVKTGLGIGALAVIPILAFALMKR